MRPERIAFFLLFLTTWALRGDARREISLSEATILMADRARDRPRVELYVKDGRKLKGRLLDATIDQFRLDRLGPVATCSVSWIKVQGATASPRRLARGIVAGFVISAYLTVAIAFESGRETLLHPAVVLPIAGLGSVAGERIAAKGEDMIYVLKYPRPGDFCWDELGGLKAAPDEQ